MTKKEAQRQVDEWDSIIGSFSYLEANVGLGGHDSKTLQELREKRYKLSKEFNLESWYLAEVGCEALKGDK